MGISKEAEKNKPKKPLTAYFMYSAEMREDAKKDDPDAKLSAAELGDMWKNLDSKKKQKYTDDYDEEMKAYKAEL